MTTLTTMIYYAGLIWCASVIIRLIYGLAYIAYQACRHGWQTSCEMCAQKYIASLQTKITRAKAFVASIGAA